jgi:DNA-binding SARP family transcriptional activator
MSVSASPHLRLLGGFELVAGGLTIALPVNAQRVLAFLALTGQPARGAVAGRLWPEASEPRALGNLRSAIWRLQRQCSGLLRCDGGALGLDPSVVVDVNTFVDVARAVLAHGDSDWHEVPPILFNADLLPGFYEDWVLTKQEHLRQLQLHALERISSLLSRRGDEGAALEAALVCVEIDPLRESAHRAVICVHLREGNLGEARRHYDRAVAVLANELGLPPSPSLVELERHLPMLKVASSGVAASA